MKREQRWSKTINNKGKHRKKWVYTFRRRSAKAIDIPQCKGENWVGELRKGKYRKQSIEMYLDLYLMKGSTYVCRPFLHFNISASAWDDINSRAYGKGFVQSELCSANLIGLSVPLPFVLLSLRFWGFLLFCLCLWAASFDVNSKKRQNRIINCALIFQHETLEGYSQ